MITTTGSTTPVASHILHPLDPLHTDEIAAAVAIMRASGRCGPQMRFASIILAEPAKSIVLGFKAGDTIEREACAVLLDNGDGATYEVCVSLTRSEILAWKHVPGVQAGVMLDEFFECEEAIKRDSGFQAALHKRGITDFSLLMVDPWPAGNYGDEPASWQGRRLLRALTWVRSDPTDNGYAYPIEGLVAIFDLNEMRVLEVLDRGVTPLPSRDGNYTPDRVGGLRDRPKPLEVVQPEGPSFTVDGHHINWQKWNFRIGWTNREGLVLYTISYNDAGKQRPIIYRASLAEMTVPYGDPHENHRCKNAFDVGEYGLGTLANSLTLGCDCLGDIRYFDVAMNDSRGNALKIPNAICMHEEDYGILWKHVDWRTGHTEVRRSRRLVVSFIATVGNYEYGYYWYFYQDGSIQYEVKLTGIMHTGALPQGETRKYGTVVAPGLYTPNHQHFFSVRLDMMVDGLNNSIYEVHTEAEPIGPENPYGNAFVAKQTLLATEQEAQQQVDPLNARYWLIANPTSHNRLGHAVAYKLMPGENVRSFLHPESSVSKRAAYMANHLWVTPYHPEERYPTGDYPNQHAGGAGLPAWTAANRSIEQTNLVVWYTIGAHHIPRPEDWPVMPCSSIGFMLKPVGFFERNPGLDVPPSPSHTCHDEQT